MSLQQLKRLFNAESSRKVFKTDTTRKVIQLQGVRFCSSKEFRQGHGLGAVAACVYRFMQERGTNASDLLILDNPADEVLVEKIRRAGVKKIACTVKNEKQYLNFQEQLAGPTDVYSYNLLAMHKRGTIKLSKAVEKENEILSSAGDISGVVVLASGVSDIEHLHLHKYLVKRLMVMEASAGLHSLHKLDWFLVLPESTVKTLTFNYNIVRCLNAFYEHRNCLTMKYADVASIFHADMEIKGRKGLGLESGLRLAKKVAKIEGNDVCLVHFKPKFNVLEKLSLDERVQLKNFVYLISGHQRLIPALEKVFPGCGLGMIELGYSMADEIFHIPHDQLLQLYKDVKSLPEYESSVLHDLCAGKDTATEQLNDLKVLDHIGKSLLKKQSYKKT